MVKKIYILAAAAVAIAMSSCSKVEPTGILVAASDVNDRVKATEYSWTLDSLRGFNDESTWSIWRADGDYHILMGADPHIVDDLGRVEGFFEEMMYPVENDEAYAFCTLLGDIVDTQPEYYSQVDQIVDEVKKYYEDEFQEKFHFYTIVGNHDITHNGWTLFYSIFGPSTYYTIVGWPTEKKYQDAWDTLPDSIKQTIDYTFDIHIFLDSANGTFGKRQWDDYIDPWMELFKEVRANNNDYEDGSSIRNIFIYTHNPFFRPKQGFSANFPREEYYRCLNTFAESGVNWVFSGHLHAPGYEEWRGVHYQCLDAFGERNRPDGGTVYDAHVSGYDQVKLREIVLK